MVLYPLFYRRFGVRIAAQLMTPVVSSIDKFEFPRNSVYHFVSFDGVQIGPLVDDYLLRQEQKPIAMHHITEMVTEKGAPRKLTVPILNSIRTYHARNKRFRLVVDDDNKPKDETTLYIYNYGFIPQSYRYTRNVFTEYYKWFNTEKTVWKNIDKCASSSNRQQFIFMQLPKVLPSVATLNLYSKVVNPQFVKIFNNRDSLLILEIWKWLSEFSYQESILSQVQNSGLDKVNLVVQDGTNWSMINLGVLHSWKKSQDPDVVQKFSLPAEQLQKRFLRMLMSLMERRIQPEQVDSQPEQGEDAEQSSSIPAPEDTASLQENLDPESLSAVGKSEKILMQLDDDLKSLEDIEKMAFVDEDDKKISSKAIDPQLLFKDVDIEQQLLTDINTMAEDGILNASDYKRLVASTQTFKKLPAAYDKTKTNEEFGVISKEMIEVKGPYEIPDIKSVLDKSMLKTTLMDFDERYIRDVLPRDNLNMVGNIQRAGIIINEYTVEKVNDVLGGYEYHTLKLKPLQGLPSTLRFKLPSVDDEGNFKINGNLYKMRRQRVD
jgi:hypothetical protein